MPQRILLAFLLLTLCTPTLAQDLLAKVAEPKGDNPDPLKLLEQSAANFQSAEHLSTTLVNTIHIKAGEMTNTTQQVFQIRLAKPNSYSLEMVKPSPEFWVRSNGEKTITTILPLKRYTVTDQNQGISDFAGSPLGKMLGNGVGAIVFSLLDTESTAGVIESTTESEYIGEEAQGERQAHHCRFHSADVKWHGWFTTDEQPLLISVKPDLSEFVEKLPAAKQFEDFKLEMTFELKDTSTKEEVPADAFALDPPEGAEQVEDLFAPPEEPPHKLLGQKAPLFDATDPAGEPIDLGALVGKKVIILDFWATWCGPCVAAMPIIDKVAGEYADKGVVFYAVNQQEDPETVTTFLKEKELDVPVAMDPDSVAGGKYFVEGLPTTAIIGLDGRVQVIHVGFSPQLEGTLREELDALLEKKDLAAEELAAWNEKHPEEEPAEEEAVEEEAEAAEEAAE